MKKYDAFISYASEDKESFALPLAEKLISIGLDIWFDDFCLKIGDSLKQKIEQGLSNSKYGIVILSHNFFSKKWPQKELNALYNLEIEGRSAILPIWLEISQKEVMKYSPLLADKYALEAYIGIDAVAAKLIERIDPKNEFPESLQQDELSKIEQRKYDDFDIRVSGNANYKLMGNVRYYDASKNYICISVSNWGKRDVIIAKVGLRLKRKEKSFIVAHDSFFFGPRRLKDGDRADYLIEQDLVEDLTLIDYVWALDQVGREWRGEFKL